MFTSVKEAVTFHENFIVKMNEAIKEDFDVSKISFVFITHSPDIEHPSTLKEVRADTTKQYAKVTGNFSEFQEKACPCSFKVLRREMNFAFSLMSQIKKYTTFSKKYLKPLKDKNLTLNDFKTPGFETEVGFNTLEAVDAFSANCHDVGFETKDFTFKTLYTKAVSLGFTDDNIKSIVVRDEIREVWREKLFSHDAFNDLFAVFEEELKAYEASIDALIEPFLDNEEMVLIAEAGIEDERLKSWFCLNEDKKLFYAPKFLQPLFNSAFSNYYNASHPANYFVTPRILTKQELETATVLYSPNADDAHSNLEQLYTTVTTI